MNPNNQKGQALWELLSVFSVLAILVSGILLAAYLMFARAWLTYQSEQALYCVAEKQSPAHCRHGFQQRVTRFLPWGTLQIRSLAGTVSGAFINVRWQLNGFVVPIQRKLDLSWSRGSRSSRWL
jgi:hypothetical protein